MVVLGKLQVNSNFIICFQTSDKQAYLENVHPVVTFRHDKSPASESLLVARLELPGDADNGHALVVVFKPEAESPAGPDLFFEEEGVHAAQKFGCFLNTFVQRIYIA